MATSEAAPSAAFPKPVVQATPGDVEGDNFDDPDQYMMLVSPFKGRNRPYIQILLPFMAVVLTIVSLSVDEIADGDWNFDDEFYLNDQFDEVDYDCGWKQLKFNYFWADGYESNERFLYSSNLCSEDEDTFDSDWCETMNSLGKVWLAFNIISLLLSVTSIAIVYKFGKSSLVYFVLNFFGLICHLIAIGDWFKNEKCSEIEDSYGDYDYYQLQTNPGASMVLVCVSAGLLLLSLLVSSIHLVQKRNFVGQNPMQMRALPVPDSDNTAA